MENHVAVAQANQAEPRSSTLAFYHVTSWSPFSRKHYFVELPVEVAADRAKIVQHIADGMIDDVSHVYFGNEDVTKEIAEEVFQYVLREGVDYTDHFPSREFVETHLGVMRVMGALAYEAAE